MELHKDTKSRTSQVAEFCEKLLAITWSIQSSDQQNSKVLAQFKVFGRSGVDSFTASIKQYCIALIDPSSFYSGHYLAKFVTERPLCVNSPMKTIQMENNLRKVLYCSC